MIAINNKDESEIFKKLNLAISLLADFDVNENLVDPIDPDKFAASEAIKDVLFLLNKNWVSSQIRKIA